MSRMIVAAIGFILMGIALTLRALGSHSGTFFYLAGIAFGWCWGRAIATQAKEG